MRGTTTSRIFVLLALALVFAMAGCSGDDAPKRSAEEQAYWTDGVGRWHEGGWRETTVEEENTQSLSNIYRVTEGS